MNDITWTDELLTGSDVIDKQHQRMIELIGSMDGKDSKQDERVLFEALNYANVHFADEEALMETVGYPGVEKQKRAHVKLQRLVQVYEKKYRAGDTDLYAFKQFLLRWIRNHILEEDKKIGAYIKSARR